MQLTYDTAMAASSLHCTETGTRSKPSNAIFKMVVHLGGGVWGWGEGLTGCFQGLLDIMVDGKRAGSDPPAWAFPPHAGSP